MRGISRQIVSTRWPSATSAGPEAAAVIAILIFLPCSISCGSERPGTTLRFRTTTVDVGTITRGQTVDLEFPFINEGQTPLRFAEIRTSCGCTAAVVSSEVFPPGEIRKVIVTVTTMQDPAGPISKNVTLTVDLPTRPQIVLEVKGSVIEEFTPTDRSIEFGSGDAREMRISLHENLDAELISAHSNDGRLTVRLARTPGAPRTRVLTVAIKPGAQPGWLTDNIVLKTSSRYLPEITMPVRGRVPGG